MAMRVDVTVPTVVLLDLIPYRGPISFQLSVAGPISSSVPAHRPAVLDSVNLSPV